MTSEPQSTPDSLVGQSDQDVIIKKINKYLLQLRNEQVFFIFSFFIFVFLSFYFVFLFTFYFFDLFSIILALYRFTVHIFDTLSISLLNFSPYYFSSYVVYSFLFFFIQRINLHLLSVVLKKGKCQANDWLKLSSPF